LNSGPTDYEFLSSGSFPQIPQQFTNSNPHTGRFRLVSTATGDNIIVSFLRRYLNLLFAPIVWLVNACRRPIGVDGIFPEPVAKQSIVPLKGEKFIPEHRQILEMTGWYAYANSNIDVIQYYDWPAFKYRDGTAIGLAFCSRGLRVTQVAIKDRSDAQVCWTIIHEAAHLSGVQQFGGMFGEQEAEAAAAKFWHKWLSLNNQN
jgi:hypothetical protein